MRKDCVETLFECVLFGGNSIWQNRGRGLIAPDAPHTVFEQASGEMPLRAAAFDCTLNPVLSALRPLFRRGNRPACTHDERYLRPQITSKGCTCWP